MLVLTEKVNELPLQPKKFLRLGRSQVHLLRRSSKLRIPDSKPSKKTEEYLSRELYFNADGSLLIARLAAEESCLWSTLDGELVSSIDTFENQSDLGFGCGEGCRFFGCERG